MKIAVNKDHMTFTIAKKLVAGFALAVVILAGMVGYNYLSLHTLADLQHDSAQRGDDAIVVAEASGMGTEMYQIIADGIINRELETTFADWKAIKEEMNLDIGNVKNIVDTPEEVKLVEEAGVAYKALVDVVEGKLFPLLETSTGMTPEIAALDGDIDSNVGIIVDRFATVMESIIEEAHEANANFDAADEETIMVSEIVGGVASLVLILIAVFTIRSIVKPINEMTAAMQRLAEGELEVDVPAQGRADEIGKMAETVQVFKDNAIEKVRLEKEQVEAEKRAETEKRAAMNKLADDFEAAVGGVVNQVSSASTEMQSSSEAMAATAEETSTQSATVAAASEQASANVQTVASAAEELSSSISEISRQVGQSSEIASNAVRQAEQTNEKVQGLAEAANKIGEVVALITDIADQTNLLALNATIEAARAGDAGKGFAVVASEVKNLANQTAKATDEIGTQISGIQTSTQEAVTAIEEIGKTISEVDEIATTIASAVEEQGAATQEIARNVEQAAAGTQEVSSNIGGVNQAASDTGAAATQIQSAAGELSQQSELLRTEVDKFLVNVRAA